VFGVSLGYVEKIFRQRKQNGKCERVRHRPGPKSRVSQAVADRMGELSEFLPDSSLAEEVFRQITLVVHCDEPAAMLRAAQSLQGHLTATILDTEKDLAENAELLQVLESKVGRVIFNGFPTGVEVCHAMVHGGPYPATSDGRSTSVGSQAIFRFARPVACQGLPGTALTDALKSANPLKILRLWNGAWSAETKA